MRQARDAHVGVARVALEQTRQTVRVTDLGVHGDLPVGELAVAQCHRQVAVVERWRGRRLVT